MAEKDELLGEQVAYYRARAPEYDDWFLCRGRYDRGPDHTNRWVSEVEMVRAELDRVDLGQSVLELACGTGLWTHELVHRAGSVTARIRASSFSMRRPRQRLTASL